MKKLRNKILSAVLVLSLLLTSSSFAFAVGENDALKYTKISGVTAVGGSSQLNPAQGNEGGYTFAFDGNTATFWHTDWSNNRTDPNGYIIFDLGRKVNLSRLEFMPRQDGNSNGRIGQYEISVSSSFDSGMTKETLEGTWSVAATGTWDWTNYTKPNVQQANLTNTLARYVKLKAIETTASHVCAAEIYCYENTVDPVITVQPESVFSSQNVELTVTAEPSAPDATLSYQWYSYNAGETAENAQVVVDGTSNTTNVTPTSESKFYYVVVTQTNDDIVGTVTSDVAEVNAGRTDYKITKESGLSIYDCSSFEEAAPPTNAIDGDEGSIWHSYWQNGSFDTERYISVDLGKDYYLSKVRYKPRKSGGTNGIFKDCDVYVSADGKNWVLLKSVTGWSSSVEWKEINIDIPAKTRYVKLVAVNAYSQEQENRFATAAEIEFYADTTTEATDMITSQPQGGTIASTGADPFILNVGAKEGSTYQWYSNDENSYIGATAISDAEQASYTPANETKYYFVKVTNGNKSINSDIVLVKSTEAKITRDGGNYFGTLLEAMNAAQAGEIIEIVRDIDLTSDITIGKNINVKSSEGNNFVLNRTESSKDSTLFAVNNGANVTFENVTIDGGAVWGGAEDSVLGRGTINNGITSTKEFFSVNSNSTLTLNTVTLQNNSRSGNGGVITVDNSTVNIINSVIKNNSSTGFSSVMWASKQNSNVVITNSEIYGNKTTNGTGSTILLEQGADLTISGGEIRNNDGNSNGGAVYLFGESTATVKDNAIISNNKSSNGGAFTLKNNDNAQLIIEDGVQIINNIGGSDGGAIYIARGTVNVGAATISGNHSNWGGAVYVGGGTANFTDTIITENRATGGRGGAFNINKVSSDIATTVNINGNTQIFKNSSSAHGGAINIQNGTVNLNGGLISENTAAQNGGAIYLGFTDGTISGNGTLNLGSSGNDFALTISENTASNGSGIYYGENGTMNINAKLNLDDEIFLYTNGLKINQKCDLSGNAPITLVGNRNIQGFITVSDDSYKTSALNVFRVKDQSPNYLLKPTAMINADLSVVRTSNWSNTKALENGSTYYRGIENNLYTVTGSENITYTWYVKNADSNEFTEVKDGLNSLSDGTYTVYCVASDDTNYMVSDVAEITVKDFYPCSKAIDKFKNI